MASLYTPESRAERVIAAGRVVLAASSLFAVWFDPTEPAKFAAVAYSLLVAYLVYSLAVALWVTQSPFLPGAQRWLSHGFDLAFFSLFTYFTSGPASPFIAYFVFSLFCATLRWRWRGTFWTALVAVATFLGLAIYFAEVLEDPSFEVTPFVIRAVYLVVFAVLLGYLGAHEERTRREMAMLAAWPPTVARTVPDAARELLSTAARIVGAPRAVAAWSDSEEPWLYLATWDEETASFESRRDPAANYEPLVSPALAGTSFLLPEGERTPTGALYRSAGRMRRLDGSPIHAALRDRLGGGGLFAVPLAGELHQGWIFFLGKKGLTSDDLVLAEIVAAIVAARLDHVQLIEELRAAAAAQERVRLARDLHDGVLQSFTGIGLRVAAARRLAEPASDPVAERLADLQRLLADEQRDLRFYIRELESPALDDDAGRADLAARLGELEAQIEQIWGIEVELRLVEPLPPIPASVARDVYSMVREGLANAARHGGASRVEVDLAPATGGLAIRVADNGRGFPYHGRFDLDELGRRDLGPRTLRARLSAVGGALTLDSSDSGSRLEMFLPAKRAVA